MNYRAPQFFSKIIKFKFLCQLLKKNQFIMQKHTWLRSFFICSPESILRLWINFESSFMCQQNTYSKEKRQIKSLFYYWSCISLCMASTHAKKTYFKKTQKELVVSSTSFRCIYTQIRKLYFQQNNVLLSKKPATNK